MVVRLALRRLYRCIVNLLPDCCVVRWLYFRAYGKLPNIQHPIGFNEKLAWRKLKQRDGRFTLYADKISVKDEIEKIVGVEHIIPTLWTGSSPEAIPFDILVPPYVIKVNHSSGGNVFIKKKDDIDKPFIFRSLRRQLAFQHWRVFREWGYKDIKPTVMVESMLTMPEGDIPEDYKFFVYHGRVHYIQVDCGRFKQHVRNMYDRDWNLLPVRLTHPQAGATLAKPKNLEEMINIAEKIGSGFDFSRVDLYSTDNGIFFGEITFYPGAGLEKFSSEEWDNKFGEPWKIVESGNKPCLENV